MVHQFRNVSLRILKNVPPAGTKNNQFAIPDAYQVFRSNFKPTAHEHIIQYKNVNQNIYYCVSII